MTENTWEPHSHVADLEALDVWEQERTERTTATALYAYVITEDPLLYHEALLHPDSNHWKTAIDDEMHSLIRANTWTITELPTNRKSISCKWVFK